MHKMEKSQKPTAGWKAVPENYVQPDNRTFQKAQKQTKVDNTLLRDSYFGDKTIRVLKQKEAHKIQVVTWVLGGTREEAQGRTMQQERIHSTGTCNNTNEVLTQTSGG